MKKIYYIVSILIVACFIATPAIGFTPQIKPINVAIDQANRAVTFAGVVTAEKWDKFVFPKGRFEKGFDPDRWHFIISGTQSNPAKNRVPIIVAWAADNDVSDALESLGAVGEKLDRRSYYDYKDKNSPYIKMKPSKGTNAKVYISWNEKDGTVKTVEPNDFLYNTSGKKYEAIFIGKQHPSDCVLCLYGCIGSIAANKNLSTEDYFYGDAVWKLKKGVLPPDGTEVLVTIKLVE